MKEPCTEKLKNIILNKIFKFLFIIFGIQYFILLNSCKVYTFTDATIPTSIKTVNVGYIENKATYVNPQLATSLTTSILQNILSKTRLVGIKNDQANYVIKGTIYEYNPTQTVGTNTTGASVNRLTVSVKFELTNNVDNSVKEFDIVRNWDFAANLTLQQAETALFTEIVKTISDDLFNQIFSNW